MIKFKQFVKLMMMTTSDHDQEALTAIRKANEQLKAEGKNWEELITGLVPMENEQQERPAYRTRPRTETPPWAEDGFQEDRTEPPRGAAEYKVWVDAAFEEALAKVRKGSSFRNTVENIHQWWLDKGFVTSAQLRVILKAAGRV